jgi:hypothetical protein
VGVYYTIVTEMEATPDHHPIYIYKIGQFKEYRNMKNNNTNMEAALMEAGVVELAPFDLLTATPEEVTAELARLNAEAEKAEAEATEKAEVAKAEAEKAEVAKANFRAAPEAEKSACAMLYMEAAERAEKAEAEAEEAVEKAEKAAAAVEKLTEDAADIMVMHNFLQCFSAEAANAASAAQIALAYNHPEKYLNNKAALQTDALTLCRRVLGDVIPEELAPSGIFKDNLTAKGALTLCALLTGAEALTLKEARAKFRSR